MKRLTLAVHRRLWPALILAPLAVGFGQTTSPGNPSRQTQVCDNEGGDIHCSASGKRRPRSVWPAARAASSAAGYQPVLKVRPRPAQSLVCSNESGELDCSGEARAPGSIPPLHAATAAASPPSAKLAPARGSAPPPVQSLICSNDSGELDCSASRSLPKAPAPPRRAAAWPALAAGSRQKAFASQALRPMQSLICENDSGELHCSPASPAFRSSPQMVRQAAAPVTPQSEGPVSPPVAVTVRAPAILASSHPREVSLAVKINGRPVSDFARLLQMGDNRFYAGGDLLQQWRLRLPAADAWSVGDQTVYRLDELPGLRASLNQAEQVLSLDVPAADFTGSQFNGMWREPLPVDHSSPGLFLNHQLQYTYTPQQSTMAGLFEAGFFSPLGVLTSRFTSRDFLSSPTPLRLDTQLTREFPDDRAALTVGDAVSSSGPWARQVNYAGIRWASDFSTQPYFMPMVLPSLAGSAAEPSTVDIYVNGLRTYRQQIDAGPFAIQNVPVMTGEGQLQMVVTDVMGRQQVITQSYINAQQLLRSGVNEYTYEAGSLRSNFGTASADYGAGFFAGSERHGFSNRLTVDGRLEASWQQQTLGLGLDYGWRSLGVLSGGFAASHGTLGPGGLAYLMFQHSSRIFGYSGSVQVANSTFEQLGMTTGERAARLLGEFQVTRNFGRRGSVSLGYLRQENRPYVDLVQPTRPDFAGVSTTFSFRVANRAYLTAGTNLSYSFKDASSATLSLVVPLGPRTTMLANSSLQQGGTPASTFEYLKQLPIGNGYGYDLRTDVDDHSRVDGTFMAQNNEGTYELETAQQQGTGISSRFTETGSLVFLHDRIMPAQWLNNSFAVVDVPDTPGVKVYTNNQYIASTSYRGLAVVPNLVPYNQNTVRLDDEGVPVDLGMDFSEKSVVPMSRSGVFLTFKATPVNGALFKLVTEKGQPLPVGTEVTVNAAPMVYSIAYRGEVFVSEVSFPAHLHARWGEQRCEAVVAAAPGNKPLPRIGPVTCKVRP